MKITKLAAAVSFLGILAIAGVALAQAVPQVQTLNPTADRIPVVPNGAPGPGNVYASPAEINATSQYVKATFTGTGTTTGYSNTFGNYQTRLTLDANATIGYNYVTFAPIPSDGAEECVFSTGAVTSLWLAASSGQTLNDAATTLTANQRVCYLYSKSNTTWSRSQ